MTAEEIGLKVGRKSRGTILYHSKRLLEEGFLTKERRGQKLFLQ
jgi:DNA-binding transcriptional ArsR family regulator